MMNRMPEWSTVYDNADMRRMPWFHPELDPDVQQAVAQLNQGVTPYTDRRLLDVGTGPGTQAAALQHLGFDVTGIDLSATAIAYAAQHYPDAKFLQDDILNSRLLNNPDTARFDIILDRGCFHVFNPIDRQTYVTTVTQLLKPGGQLWLKCFSMAEPGNNGPFRYTPESLTAVFAPDFNLISVYSTEYYGQLTPHPKALFAIFIRNDIAL